MGRVIRILVLALAAVIVGPLAAAQAQRIPVVRDAEIETSIHKMLTPIFRAAGLNPEAVTIFLVNDDDANAFVAGGQNIFVNTGLILETRSAGELMAVLAHETGHIAGGHLVRGAEQMERNRLIATIGSLLGAAAGAASGRGDAGMAGVITAQDMARQNMVNFTRGIESSADQAGLRFLAQAGIPADGMLSFLKRMQDAELARPSGSEYARTHPLTNDRIEAVQQAVETSPLRGRPMPPGYDDMFARMRAKLFGFTEPLSVARVYPPSDTGIPAQYARAIAAYRNNVFADALGRTDALIKAEPRNPYYLELRGQILLETGRLTEARPYYERALALLPGEPLLLIPLAQTKIDRGSDAELRSAIRDLERASVDPEKTPPIVWRLLGTAYGKIGDMGKAALALAEDNLSRGDKPNARAQVDRALQLLPRGSPGWRRAQDLQRQAEDKPG
ncbi:M48 family metallopeptidase [Mycobacterium sp. KBS0706]|uniref:M48 family metalloprotease n=1 Tax=Mycobacterium sp. KBS0706 TaxID=2578109 RepID=UPI00110FB9F3|nr:M48 family metalloprotease [Mycobacterium sp. KBS0706]TSD84982.1 M48 family metallopeptidase [Mycobacterium sp. KBS0706]